MKETGSSENSMVLERHELIKIPKMGGTSHSGEECSSCGNWILKGWETCQWCGEELQQLSQSSPF